jgi:hypothetical protein
MEVNLICQADVGGGGGGDQTNPGSGSEQAPHFAAADIAGADHDAEPVRQI